MALQNHVRSSRPVSVKDRLVAVARDLFVRRGLPSVGINEVIATSKVAKRSLYNHFPTKEALALAAFETEMADRRTAIIVAQEAAAGPRAAALAPFDIAEELAVRDGFRGCAFINLAIEIAAPDNALHALARRHKDWVLDRFLTALRETGIGDPDDTAGQLRVLWDGGIVGAYVQGDAEPIRAARRAAARLIDAAIGTQDA